MNIGDRVKFKTMGGWYNSGIIMYMDEDSYLIAVDKLGYKPPENACISLPYYVRVLSCEIEEMGKFKDRKEQREVTEVMNALLLPMLNYLNADAAIKVKRALYLLGEIEPQEKEDIVDHTCEEKQEQTRDEKLIDDIDFAIKATNSQDDYSMGMRNGMRYVKSLIDGKKPQYELGRTDDEIKLGIDLGDEVVGDYGSKGVVVGIDTYRGEVLLSLLMKNHKVPQLVEASGYKTKTGRHFPQIIEVLEQMKGEADGK